MSQMLRDQVSLLEYQRNPHVDAFQCLNTGHDVLVPVFASALPGGFLRKRDTARSCDVGIVLVCRDCGYHRPVDRGLLRRVEKVITSARVFPHVFPA
ncbi:MAG: hypothetical protein KGI50_01405 [Patescibacteria group bacterium]|nr:hypothetical protein [Patescibacteria group bacterium]MDE2437995.1 hypothetical protein [Patescibacteria group bacterium]